MPGEQLWRRHHLAEEQVRRLVGVVGEEEDEPEVSQEGEVAPEEPVEEGPGPGEPAGQGLLWRLPRCGQLAERGGRGIDGDERT
jgi:hypothetical protein